MPTVKNQTDANRFVRERAKYPQLVEWLSSQISRGVLEVGDRLPPFVDLQAEFNVTPNTVNRAMIELERRGLIERRHGSGVYVAPPKVRPRTGIIGVSGPGFDFTDYSSYWSNVFQGIRHGARQAGVQVLLLDHTSGSNWEKADGVIFCDWGGANIQQFIPTNLPCVSLLARTADYPSVTADDYGGMQEATEYLLALGHRRIATMHRANSQYIIDRRIAAYHDTMRSHNIVPNPQWNYELVWIGDERYDYGRRFVQTGYESMRTWLSHNWFELGCTAILAQNDEVALGIIEALDEIGLSVPDDVSVIGFDGTEGNSYQTQNLTTVKVPLSKIACAAVELLHRQIAGESMVGRHEVFETHICPGNTTTGPKPASTGAATGVSVYEHRNV